MKTVSRILVAGALAVWGVACATPSLASSFGNPRMYVVVGQIPSPYVRDFNLNTGVVSWPLLLSPIQLTEADQLDGVILIHNVVEHFDTLYNQTATVAMKDGFYGAMAGLQDNFPAPGYSGVFSYAQISQDFVKDSVGAYLNFHIGYTTPPVVAARGVAVDSTRAEFAIDIQGYTHTSTFSQFHQDAGVRAEAGPAGPTIFARATHGPMPFTDTFYPPGLNFTETILFPPYTGSLDLSSLNVGDTFTVMSKAMTQCDWAPGEVPRAFAQIADPAGNGGIELEIAGVHAVGDVTNPILEAGNSGPAAVARLSAPWPNPARGEVSFSLEVPKTGDYSVTVFDLSGRRVAEVAHGTFAPGTHALSWNASRGRDGQVPAGVYFVRALGPGLDSVRRVVRLSD